MEFSSRLLAVEDFRFNRRRMGDLCIPRSARRRAEIEGGFKDVPLPDCFYFPCRNNYSWLIMLVFKAGN